MSGAHAGFLDGFGTLRPRAIWGNCRHHRAMRTQCATVAELQTRSAPRGWHHFGPNIPDGHQNGLIWGPLIPWNPVNALQSWRRLCDPNGSLRVVVLKRLSLASSQELKSSKARQFSTMRALPSALVHSVRCFLRHGCAQNYSRGTRLVVAKSRGGAPLPRCACLRLTSSAAVTRGDDRALGTPVPGFPQCAAASLRASVDLLPQARGGAQ